MTLPFADPLATRAACRPTAAPSVRSPRAARLVAVAILLAVAATAPTATAQAGHSTFGDARARELAELGRLPSAREIVVRDLVDYRRHQLPLPTADQAVALDVRAYRGTVEPGGEAWLQVGYTTRSEGDRALAPPCAVTLVVDCSGSMAERGKMVEVHRGLAAFVARLRPDDEVALVAFASDARVVTGLRRCGDGTWLQDAILALQPGGSTNLHAGLMLGLEQLQRGDVGLRTRRLVVLTDGIANVGVTDANAIADDVRGAAADRIDVSTIGLGRDLEVGLLQRLADTNRGLFHYVADERDVQKVFVAEADSLLVPAARRVVLTIELPDGLEAIDVVGHDAERATGTLRLALPDLNAGATGVVMLRCRASGEPSERLDVRARLTFLRADTGRRDERTAATTVRAADRRADAPVDLEVARNAAIAVLAEGLHTMADACDRRRWADADRALRLAVDDARHLFPGDDADVQRVRDIVAGHQRTLRRYVDRFRDV